MFATFCTPTSPSLDDEERQPGNPIPLDVAVALMAEGFIVEGYAAWEGGENGESA